MHEDRIKSLEKRHAKLEKEVRVLERSPGHDWLAVRRLKRLKLQLKEQIERFKRSPRAVAEEQLMAAE